MEIKIDLIQVVAAKYGLDYIVGDIREVAALGKERIEQGKDGAYLEGQFDLIIKGTIDAGLLQEQEALIYDIIKIMIEIN